MNLPPRELQEILLVVPCYNESKRWDSNYWKELSEIVGLRLLFVNDGSTDDTENLIRNVTFDYVNLVQNAGKAEAIRHGFNRGLIDNPFGIGFLDADAAFTPAEVKRQMQCFLYKNSSSSYVTAVWSSRVQMAGRNISRRLSRHYLARVIITFLAVRLKFSIYDPQSGLKIYPSGPELAKCFEVPFKTRWFVDLEIYERYKLLNGAPMLVWEEPVDSWKDVAGSKINSFEYFRILKDILHLLK